MLMTCGALRRGFVQQYELNRNLLKSALLFGLWRRQHVMQAETNLLWVPSRRQVRVAVVTSCLMLGALSVGWAESAIDFWNNEYKRVKEWRTEKNSEPATRITVKPNRAPASEGTIGAVPYCVRSCDGYYFPLSSERLSRSQAKSLCQSLCPAASTEVYSRRSESFADAVSFKGQRYSDLPKAFAYREKVMPNCTCRRAGSEQMHITDDSTLRSGDIVVTAEGVRIFQGGHTLPHTAREFVDYKKVRTQSGQLRNYLDFVDRSHRSQTVTTQTHTISSAASATDARANVPTAGARRWISNHSR